MNNHTNRNVFYNYDLSNVRKSVCPSTNPNPSDKNNQNTINGSNNNNNHNNKDRRNSWVLCLRTIPNCHQDADVIAKVITCWTTESSSSFVSIHGLEIFENLKNNEFVVLQIDDYFVKCRTLSEFETATQGRSFSKITGCRVVPHHKHETQFKDSFLRAVKCGEISREVLIFLISIFHIMGETQYDYFFHKCLSLPTARYLRKVIARESNLKQVCRLLFFMSFFFVSIDQCFQGRVKNYSP